MRRALFILLFGSQPAAAAPAPSFPDNATGASEFLIIF